MKAKDKLQHMITQGIISWYQIASDLLCIFVFNYLLSLCCSSVFTIEITKANGQFNNNLSIDN